jgi:hypothetical protein
MFYRVRIKMNLKKFFHKFYFFFFFFKIKKFKLVIFMVNNFNHES